MGSVVEELERYRDGAREDAEGWIFRRDVPEEGPGAVTLIRAVQDTPVRGVVTATAMLATDEPIDPSVLSGEIDTRDGHLAVHTVEGVPLVLVEVEIPAGPGDSEAIEAAVDQAFIAAQEARDHLRDQGYGASLDKEHLFRARMTETLDAVEAALGLDPDEDEDDQTEIPGAGASDGECCGHHATLAFADRLADMSPAPRELSTLFEGEGDEEDDVALAVVWTPRPVDGVPATMLVAEQIMHPRGVRVSAFLRAGAEVSADICVSMMRRELHTSGARIFPDPLGRAPDDRIRVSIDIPLDVDQSAGDITDDLLESRCESIAAAAQLARLVLRVNGYPAASVMDDANEALGCGAFESTP